MNKKSRWDRGSRYSKSNSSSFGSTLDTQRDPVHVTMNPMDREPTIEMPLGFKNNNPNGNWIYQRGYGVDMNPRGFSAARSQGDPVHARTYSMDRNPTVSQPLSRNNSDADNFRYQRGYGVDDRNGNDRNGGRR